jgi:hypothetical protein
MSKQNKAMKNSISTLGKGVLDLFENDANASIPETNVSKDDNSKTVKETKSKRSFMLTDTAVQRLNLLKLCSVDNKDLSSIVEAAINEYFEKNKDSIEQLVNVYNKVK